jgi:hypothetical protein
MPLRCRRARAAQGWRGSECRRASLDASGTVRDRSAECLFPSFANCSPRRSSPDARLKLQPRSNP